MTDREKAIRILEGKYKNFVLRHNGELLTVNELIALLKAQQPRMMMLEELDDLRGRGRAVWFEDRDDSAKCQDVFFVVASGIHAYFKGETYSMLKMVDGYGKSWRCWTSRPDEKVRAETPWES